MASHKGITCPHWRVDLAPNEDELTRAYCGAVYPLAEDVPVVLPRSLTEQQRSQTTYFDFEFRTYDSYRPENWRLSFVRRIFGALGLPQSGPSAAVLAGVFRADGRLGDTRHYDVAAAEASHGAGGIAPSSDVVLRTSRQGAPVGARPAPAGGRRTPPWTVWAREARDLRAQHRALGALQLSLVFEKPGVTSR